MARVSVCVRVHVRVRVRVHIRVSLCDNDEQVEMLFDEDTILHSMKSAEINLDEMPLGQVT